VPPRAARTPSCSSSSSSRSTSSSVGGGGFSLDPIEIALGFVSFRVGGATAQRDFLNETGGHRWQRVPPNERRGRVHTSTITVAVLPEPSEQELRLNQSDVEIKTTRGSGPGGQARNKTESCVIATHRPTGMTVRCDSGRSQAQNRDEAVRMLRARIFELRCTVAKLAEDAGRKAQVGSGQRGDKVRTIRTQDGIVTDHRLGVRVQLSNYERGDFGKILE
jgi:peptide chain release factor 1